MSTQRGLRHIGTVNGIVIRSSIGGQTIVTADRHTAAVHFANGSVYNLLTRQTTLTHPTDVVEVTFPAWWRWLVFGNPVRRLQHGSTTITSASRLTVRAGGSSISDSHIVIGD